MRVAFLVGKFPCLSQPFIVNQIIGLIDQGHEVDIYALEGPSQEAQIHPQVLDYRLQSRTYYGIFPPENWFLRLLQGLALLLRYGPIYPRSLLAVLNVIKHGKRAATLRPLFAAIPFFPAKQYDIIHCQFGVYALLGADLMAMGRLQGKLISTFRGFDISEYVRRCGPEVYANLFTVSDGVLTNCKFFRQRLIALGCPAHRVQVHYSSIDCQRFTFRPRSLPPQTPVRIVTVGRLVEKKGIEYALRAIAHLRPMGIPLTYTLVGDGPLRDRLTALVQELQLEEEVRFVGWQSQSDLIEILDQAHILIAPSVTAASGDQDAPVNTLKEAMAMGLPVIGTDHGGIPELIQDGVTGFLVPERDAAAIAARLQYLIAHSERWAAMGLAGRQHVEAHFDINVLNQELVAIYRRLLAEPPRIAPALEVPPLAQGRTGHELEMAVNDIKKPTF